MSVRRLRVPMVLMLAVAAILAQTGSSLALFTESKTAAANTLTAGSWAFYLHNNPTPPTANTAAQANLAMNTTVPTAATLWQYSTGCAARAGRRLTRAAPSPTQATLCDYQNWRTPALTVGLSLSGAISVDIWTASDTGTANRTAGVVAYLRDFNPTAGTYVEIANATYTGAYAVGRTYYERPILVAVAPVYTLAVGHMLEVKIESPTATSQNNMLVAYDTTADSSVVRVR